MLQNYKRGFRFKQVLVNGKLVWEEDLLGRNPQPARRRRHQADITSFLAPGADSCSITLRILDRKGSGDQPFAYWPDKSIKVAAVAFPATVTANGSTNYRFEAGAGVEAFSKSVGLQLTESAGRITVHTGVIEATLSKTYGTLLETVTRDGQVLKTGKARWDLAFLDESGRELRSSASAVASTDIVERGPNRVVLPNNSIQR